CIKITILPSKSSKPAFPGRKTKLSNELKD
ncbi:MAG: hypothetical protein ACI9G6_002848, partial [Limisphaerales bacterium]